MSDKEKSSDKTETNHIQEYLKSLQKEDKPKQPKEKPAESKPVDPDPVSDRAPAKPESDRTTESAPSPKTESPAAVDENQPDEEEHSSQEKKETEDWPKAALHKEDDVPSASEAPKESAAIKAEKPTADSDSSAPKNEGEVNDSGEVEAKVGRVNEVDENVNTEVSSKQPEDSPSDPPKAESGIPEGNVSTESTAGEASSDSSDSESDDTASSSGNDDNSSDEEDEEVDDDLDISNLDKAAILAYLKELLSRSDKMKQIKTVRLLKDHYKSVRGEEREAALEKFISEGGEKDGFEYRTDPEEDEFFSLYKEFMQSHREHRQSQDSIRKTNLTTKKRLLAELRDLVDSDENEASINKFKKIQAQWREAGMVPATEVKELWANYHALVDRFYNNRRVFSDLIDLDRKKNLASKQALVERAEKLMDVTIIKHAINELNEIHEEFKHVGPAPRDEQEVLWQRLKTVSDKLHDKRSEFLNKRHIEFNDNLIAKQSLLIKLIESVQADTMTSPKHWIAKTEEVLAIRDEWKTIGPVPTKKFQELNKNFWNSYKTFFNAKNNFFKGLDQEKAQNLAEKTAMCEQVEAWLNEDNWASRTEDIKRLQQEWRDIGPVPGKYRESIYQRFKKACDEHFEKKRRRHEDRKDEEHENLAHKRQIISEMKAIGGDDTGIKEKLEELREKFAGVGEVPYSERVNVQQEFSQALDKVIGRSDTLADADKEKLALEIEVGSTEDEGELRRLMERKETQLRRRISDREADISTLKVNLQFFGRSNKANEMKEQYERQVEKAEQEIGSMKEQLKHIRKSL